VSARRALVALFCVVAPLPALGTEWPAPDPTLSADAIYQRVLENRFDASVQELALVSGDRGGHEQALSLQMLWRRYPDASPEGEEGVQSRTLVRYLEPGDMRGAGYLIINKRDDPDDQFMYVKSLRRVRRVSLRNETVIGTDLSVEDIVPREMHDATYARFADGAVQGRSCYVIEAIPRAEADSVYSKFLLYVETLHFVPIRTRYWDRGGVEIKRLDAEAESIREIDGIWVPLRASMRHLLDESWTRLRIELLSPNPDLPKHFFTQRQLQARKLRLPETVMQGARSF
jgi:hypothetical protein